MLKSIFYARFHQEHGPKVIHQVPEGSIIPCPPSPTAQTPFFNFQSISEYIIPRREFCDRLLSVCTNRQRIIGFPVCVTDDTKYDRNDFIFNFCIVLDEEAAWSAHATVVTKLARLFRNLEEQIGFLSHEEKNEELIVAGEEGYGGGSKVYALCEMIMEDLNNYCECMIPIDESNTLNLKLFPVRPPPPPVHDWYVPLSVVRFNSLQTSAWDLTVQRIIPYIDGVNAVSNIATLADTDPSLTRRAIAHLVYYGCIILLDIFAFSAIYAPTPSIATFVSDTAMQDECRAYISSPFSMYGRDIQGLRTLLTTFGSTNQSSAAATQSFEPPSRNQVIDLYTSLRQGQALREWCLANADRLARIDIRRFVTFGVIKGFLYRSHKYAIALRPADLEREAHDPIAVQRERERAYRKAAMSSGWVTPLEEKEKRLAEAAREEGMGTERPKSERGKKGGIGEEMDLRVKRYVDGMHCLDEVCTELRITEKEAVRRLRESGHVLFVQR